MKAMGAFVVGFATGWLARSTVESTRGALVRGMAAGFSLLDFAKRAVGTEREFFSDLVAEARVRVRGPAAWQRPASGAQEAATASA